MSTNEMSIDEMYIDTMSLNENVSQLMSDQ